MRALNKFIFSRRIGGVVGMAFLLSSCTACDFGSPPEEVGVVIEETLSPLILPLDDNSLFRLSNQNERISYLLLAYTSMAVDSNDDINLPLSSQTVALLHWSLDPAASASNFSEEHVQISVDVLGPQGFFSILPPTPVSPETLLSASYNSTEQAFEFQLQSGVKSLLSSTIQTLEAGSVVHLELDSSTKSLSLNTSYFPFLITPFEFKEDFSSTTTLLGATAETVNQTVWSTVTQGKVVPFGTLDSLRFSFDTKNTKDPGYDIDTPYGGYLNREGSAPVPFDVLKDFPYFSQYRWTFTLTSGGNFASATLAFFDPQNLSFRRSEESVSFVIAKLISLHRIALYVLGELPDDVSDEDRSWNRRNPLLARLTSNTDPTLNQYGLTVTPGGLPGVVYHPFTPTAVQALVLPSSSDWETLFPREEETPVFFRGGPEVFLSFQLINYSSLQLLDTSSSIKLHQDVVGESFQLHWKTPPLSQSLDALRSVYSHADLVGSFSTDIYLLDVVLQQNS